MIEATDQDHLTAPPAVDSGLRCPACEYNLTGVAEDRCPECGGAFDRQRLLAILAGAPGPITIWDDERRNILVRFVLMCLITWFMPWRLPVMVPRRYRRRSLRTFQRMAMAVAVSPVIAMVAANASTNLREVAMRAGFCLVLCFGGWVGVTLCEAMLGGVLITSLTPEDSGFAGVGPDANYCWAGVVGFLRSFTTLAVWAICLSLLPAVLSLPVRGLEFKVVCCVAVWWWAALSAAILRQPASVGPRIGCIWLIPFAAAFAGFLGVIVTMLLMLPLRLFEGW